MTHYEFDRESFSFRKATSSIGGILWRTVKWIVAGFSLAAFYYVIISLFISTDVERKLARENRMYEKTYEELLERQKLLEEDIDGLKLRDDDIYHEIFHTKAPPVDPVAALISGGVPQDDDLVGYAARKSVALNVMASDVEENFLRISAAMASKGFVMPPMRVPVDNMTYAQIGAGEGARLSPFYKVPVQHNGLDIIAGQGEPVYASASGTVSDVIHSGKGLGNVVVIDHANGYVTKYCHLADILVSKGQKVSAGKRIASIGISGSSFAPHLHYEVWHDGAPEDPVSFLFASLAPEEYAAASIMSARTEQSLD